jgi:hypothetical protein
MCLTITDKMHGAALLKIVESEKFTAINRVEGKRGQYRVYSSHAGGDKSCYISVKYASEKSSRGADGSVFQFNLSESDVEFMRNYPTGHLVLICGEKELLSLSVRDVECVTDTGKRNQNITVRCEKGTRLRVTGPAGDLGRKVARKEYPNEIIDS